MTYLCAVGDSFVFGAELVTTYFGDDYKHMKYEEMSELEFSVHKNKYVRDKYYEQLDSLRFTALAAKQLGYEHINYAQGGASQEGIKFQAYLLLSHLKKQGINPADTKWVVGTTARFRRFEMSDPHEVYHDWLIDRCESNEYVWSRSSVCSMFMDRLEQPNTLFSEKTVKELIAVVSDTQLTASYIMNVYDTIHLLKMNGVTDILVLNFFQPDMFNEKAKNRHVAALNKMMKEDIVLLPNHQETLCQTIFRGRKSECQQGHMDKAANIQMANMVVEAFRAKSN